MTNEHATLAEEADVLDRAVDTVRSGASTMSGAVEEAHRYLEGRFLPHARLDADRCARLALRDHRHPEGACGEPEVEALTQRLEHVRRAIASEGPSASVTHLLETLLDQITPKVHAHLADVDAAPRAPQRAATRER